MDSRFDNPHERQDQRQDRGPDRGDGDPGRLADDIYGAGPTPECARVAPLLEAFYDDALDEAQTQRVAGHLSACAFCAARMRRYAEIDRLVRVAPAPMAGPALRVGVYRAIAASQADTVTTTAVALRERRERDTERSNPGWSQPGRSFPGNWRPVPPRAPRAVWAAGAAALCIILAFAVVFIASRPGTGRVTPGATASATVRHQVGILPAFHDWRAAYLDQFDGLHVVSLDGKSDTLITTLDGLTVFNSQMNSQGGHVAITPDGYTLAYIDNPKWGAIHLVDLRATTPAAQSQRVIPARASGIMWSPDGRWLLVVDTINGTFGLYRMDPHTETMTLIPGYSESASAMGWLDATHLLMISSVVGPSTTSITSPIARTGNGASTASASRELAAAFSSGPYTYYTVDVTAGTIQPAAITVPAGWSIMTLLPGTTEALVESGGPGACGAPCSPTQPTAYALLDYSTGVITKTPKINSIANGNMAYVAADPVAGSGLFVAAPYVTQPAVTHLFLCDPAHDGARPLATALFPVDWTPDGQTLLLADLASLYSNTGVGGLSTLSITSTQAQPTAIGQNMVRYLGLVRSA